MSKGHYVTGLRAVEHLLDQRSEDVRRLYVEYQTANPRVEAILATARQKNIETQPANRARLRQISGENRHQGVVAEVRRSQLLDDAALRNLVEALLEADEKPFLLVLDGIQDPHNLGACLRSADAAGVHAVVVPRHGGAGLGPTVSKVAAGAAEAVPFAAVANTGRVLDWLADYGLTIVGTSDKADTLIYDCPLNGGVVLVMGREETGLRKHIAERCQVLARLPMAGSVSSLNVSVATGICLFETVRQRAGALEASGS